MTTPHPLHGCFATGTGVGKTQVSAALLYEYAQQGWRSDGLKPVAAGTVLIDGQPVNKDVRALCEAGSVALGDAEATPAALAAHLDNTALRSGCS